MGILETISTENDSFKLKFEHRPDYLYVFVGEGRDSLAISREYWKKAFEECEQHNFHKLLVEEDLEGKLSATETYQLAVELSKKRIENILVAFVDRHPDHQESNQFGELIVTNRGFRCKVLNDITEAEQWLLQQ